MILFLSSLIPATGNCITAKRISSYLSPPHSVCLESADVAEPTTPLDHYTLAIGLHCWRAGRFFPLPNGAPSILLLGGTDMNDHPAGGGEERSAVMLRALRASSAIVAFSLTMSSSLTRFLSTRGVLGEEAASVLRKLHCIPQGIEVAPLKDTVEEAGAEEGNLRALLGLPAATPLVLLVAGLRAVKDPLLLLPAFSAWAPLQGTLSPVLVLVGPQLDEDVTAAVLAHAGVDAAAGRPWGGLNGVFYLPVVPRHTLLAYMRCANVLLNTSRSEGQSNAILEAMAQGTPVLVRNIPGNTALVAHGDTGLVFGTPAEAMAALGACLGSSSSTAASTGRWRTSLAADLARRAHAYVSAHHTEGFERQQWLALVQRLTSPVVPALQQQQEEEQGAPAYVPFSLCHISPRQREASETVRDALEFMGFHFPDRLSPVLEVPRGSVWGEGGGAGALPRAWGQPGDKDDARWPSRPYIYNFTSSGAAPTSSSGDGERLLVQPNIRDPGSGAVVRLGWGRFWEDRNIYTSSHFASPGGAGLSRTLHIGVDMEAPAGTPVHSPLAGRVHSVGIDRSELGYGPTIILEHRALLHEEVGGVIVIREATFYTLFGHLSAASLFAAGGGDGGGGARVPLLAPGTHVAQGAVIARLGSPLNNENGGWWPHVHMQIMVEEGLGKWKGDYPGVCRPVDAGAYRVLMLDPNLLLRCPFVEPVGGWSPSAAKWREEGRALLRCDVGWFDSRSRAAGKD